jgi:hypothetical protein
MPTVQQILSDPEIERFLNSHQGATAGVQRAAEQLHENPDAIEAVKKLLGAHSEKRIFVFFSYKKKDETEAKAVIDLLDQCSAGKLSISCQADCDEKFVGQNWRNWIKEKISSANWFILLLPDPSDDWDWCLFETGLFDRGFTSADRLICLHHPETEIPSPIEGYHAVAATTEEIERFLKMIFIEENPIPGMEPLNRALDRDIPMYAERISNAITPPRKRPYREIYEPWIELQDADAARLQAMNEFDQALVVSANDAALRLFDFLKKPKTFGELRSRLPKSPEDGWRKELFQIIVKIANGWRFYPIQGLVRTIAGKWYLPVLCAVDRQGSENGPVSTYHVMFTEEVTAIDGTAIPKHIMGLATILRFAFRFRWEVLERYGNQTITEEDIPRLQNAMLRIAKDWESRGLGGEDFVKQLYPIKEAKRISDMFAAWSELYNPKEAGKLDIAIKDKDVQKISKLLGDVLPMNQQFLEMTADYFSKEISAKSD